MRAFTASLNATCLLVAALSAAPASQAATVATNQIATGSGCQLSTPTTNTAVRPKASGIRNESASISNFVICPVVLSNASGNGITALYLGLYSLDGTSRNVTCTAVSNWFGTSQVYSSKTLAVTTTLSYQIIQWDATNFGGIAGGTFVALSVTCNLPPQTAINLLQSSYIYAVGA